MEQIIARILLKRKAVTLSPKKPFTLASGLKSPIYCDNRILLGYPEDRERIVGYFVELLKGEQIDLIAGTATAGIPWAAWVADRLKKPMVFVRKEAKGHGKGRQIEGEWESGQTAVVIEDLISTGGSSFAAVDALRKAGIKVKDCIAIFSYTLKNAEELFRKGACAVSALSTVGVLLDEAEKAKYIAKEDKAMVLAWKNDPEGWR